MPFPRLSLAILSAAALAGCAAFQPQPDAEALQSAFVILGDDGAPIARAITTAPRCPGIEIDGKAASMNIRSPLSAIPLRPQATEAKDRPTPVSSKVQS
jgi:hypothetical protein